MENPPAPAQLKMSFGSDNALACRLNDGEFLILLERNSPGREQPFDSAIALDAAIAKQARTMPEIAGLTVTDRLKREESHSPVETAVVLAEASGKPIVLHVSGKGSSAERVRDIFARAASSGIRSILAVTGDRADKHVMKRHGRRVPRYLNGYLDAVEILRLAGLSPRRFFAGSVVNPFKYTPAHQYLQYYKMVRKLATGAEFVVAQVGWDMKKLQELQWYLQMRDIGNPVLARLVLLSIHDIETIHEGLFPGVHVARSFAAMLQRESTINATQCLAAQLQRLALQVSGCKLLGYNGVQIAGIPDTRTLDMVMPRIQEALRTYRSYPDWLTAWNEFHRAVRFDPIPDPYYVYHGLMTPEHQMYDPDGCFLTDRSLPVPSWPDKFRHALLPRLLAERAPRVLSRVARVLAYRDCDHAGALLRHCGYLSPAACPKRLVYGPCGGSSPDGTCEFGNHPCFFVRVLALAAETHTLDRLEEGIANE